MYTPTFSAEVLLNNNFDLDHSQLFAFTDTLLTARVHIRESFSLDKVWLVFGLTIPNKDPIYKHTLNGGISYTFFSIHSIIATIHLTPEDLTLGINATNNVCKYELYLIHQRNFQEQKHLLTSGIALLNTFAPVLDLTGFPSRELLGTQGGFFGGHISIGDFEGEVVVNQTPVDADQIATLDVSASRIDAASGVSIIRTSTSNIVSVTFEKQLLDDVFPAHQILYFNGQPEAVITFCSDYDGTIVTLTRQDGSTQNVVLDSGRTQLGTRITLDLSVNTQVTRSGVTVQRPVDSNILAIEFNEVEIKEGLPAFKVIRDSGGNQIALLTYFSDYVDTPVTFKMTTGDIIETF